MAVADLFYAYDSSGNQTNGVWTAAKFWNLGSPPTAASDAGMSAAYSKTLTLNTTAEVHSWSGLGGLLYIATTALTIDSSTDNSGNLVVDQGQIRVGTAGSLTIGPSAGAYQVYTLLNYGSLSVGANSTLITSGTIAGKVSGGGVLQLNNAALSASSLTIAEVDLKGTVTLGVNLTSTGSFNVNGGGFHLQAHKLTLSGSSNAFGNGGSITGPGWVDITGSATFDAFNFVGVGNFLIEDAGSIRQTGPVGLTGGTAKIDSGASYTIAAATKLGSYGVGAIVNFGSLVDDSGGGVATELARQFTNYGKLTVNAGDTLFLSGITQTLYGQITGAGALEVSGTTVFNRAVTISELEFAGGQSTFGALVTNYSGAFVVGSSTTSLDLSGQTLTLSGATINFGVSSILYGPGTLRTVKPATLGDFFTVFGATLEDKSWMTETGSFDIGSYTVGGTTYNGELLIDAGAAFVMAAGNKSVGNLNKDNSFVNNGRIIATFGSGQTSTFFGFDNNKLLYVNGGGTLEIDGNFVNDGTINVNFGSLTVRANTTGTGVVSIAAHRSARFESSASGQTIDFTGQSASLLLDAPAQFSSTIAGFMKNDAVDFDTLTWAAGDHVGFAASGTGGMLEVLDAGGNMLASVSVSTLYNPSQFTIGADASHKTLVTFTG